MIEYVKGDLFVLTKGQTDIIIPHVVNNQSVFGGGFVVPLAKAFPKVKEDYHTLVDRYPYECKETLLGQVQYVECGPIVANMFAQTLGGKRPLFYNKLIHCMENVANRISFYHTNHKIVAPKFGSALAGGSWTFIEELIKDIWGNLDVTICEL